MTSPIFDPEKLVEFIQGLHLHGFVFSTEQYTAAQDLLITLVAQGHVPSNPQNLSNWLAPILCTSPEEQRIFHDEFKRWLERQPQHDPETREAEDRAIAGSRSEIKDINRRDNRRFRFTKPDPASAAFMIAVVILLASIILLPSRENLSGVVVDEDKNPISNAEVVMGKQRTVSNEAGQFFLEYQLKDLPSKIIASHNGYKSASFDVNTANEIPLSITLKKLNPSRLRPIQSHVVDKQTSVTDELAQQQPSKSETEIYRERFKWMLAGMLLLPFLFFGAWWIQRVYGLRRLRLIKRGSDEEYSVYSFMVKGASDKLFKGQVLRPIARELRQYRQFGSNEIDTTLTVKATARKAGLFTPVYGLRKEQPEYLALIDRASLDDHQAHVEVALINRLVEEGIIVEQYFFHGSPLVCYRKDSKERPRDLQELMARYPRHLLLIFSDGDGLINKLTAEPHRWLKMLTTWSVCALLTPKEPANWGYYEGILLEQGIVVVPANTEGLASLIETIRTGIMPRLHVGNKYQPFPEMLIERPRRWLEHHEPMRAVADKLCLQLWRFLGDEGYYLLGACAVYPVLHWQLTLYLAYKLGGSDDLEERLRSLIRLPWFHYGNMPDWLRLRLISALPKEYEKLTRQALMELLKSSLEKPDSSFFKLPYTKDEDKNGDMRGGKGWWTGFVHKIRAWNRKRLWRYLIGSEPEQVPLHDYVFLAFMSWHKPRKLSLDVPTTLRRTLYPEGQAALGLRPIIVLFALLCSAVTFLALTANSLKEPKPDASKQDASRVIFRLTGHRNIVYSVAYSRDGKVLASGSWDNTVGLWDAVTGEKLDTLPGDSGSVFSVAFSPDNKMLASSSWDGRVKLWDVSQALEIANSGSVYSLVTGAELISPSRQYSPVYSVAFSTDSKKLASGTWDGTVKLWDTATGAELITLSGHSDNVHSVAFSPDDKMLASGSWDGTVKLWNVDTGSELATFAEELGPVYSVAFSPDGKLLASGGWDGTIRIWDMITGDYLNTWKGHSGSVYSVAFSPDSRLLASGHSQWKIKLWDVGTGTELTTLSEHSGPVYSVAFSPDGKVLASGSQDKTIKLWDLTGIIE